MTHVIAFFYGAGACFLVSAFLYLAWPKNQSANVVSDRFVPKCRHCGTGYGAGQSGLLDHRRICLPYIVDTAVEKAFSTRDHKTGEVNIGTLTATLRGVDALSPVLRQAQEAANNLAQQV